MKMKIHAISTVNYIIHLIQCNPKSKFVPQIQLQLFKKHLIQLLLFKLEFNCLPVIIHVCKHSLDPLLLNAATLCQWSKLYLQSILPNYFTITIQDQEVYIQSSDMGAKYIIYDSVNDPIYNLENSLHSLKV